MKKFVVAISFLILPALRGNAKDLIQSPYTDIIEKLSEKDAQEFWKKYSFKADGKIQLTCLETSEHKLYIGLWHGLTINSNLKDAALVLEDFEKYPEVFNGIVGSKVITKPNVNQWLVEFENKSPVFFLPNIRYQTEYKMQIVPSGKLYKYHLSGLYPQNSITYSDGLILLKEEKGVTKFYELDFFNANWGIAGNLAGSNIWSDSIKELAVSDLELKAKAENLKLSISEIKEKTESFLKEAKSEQLFEKCIKDKINSNKFFNKQ